MNKNQLEIDDIKYLDCNKILKELGFNLDGNLSFEVQMILFMILIFQGKIDIDFEKLKQICKNYGLDEYIKDFEFRKGIT